MKVIKKRIKFLLLLSLFISIFLMIMLSSVLAINNVGIVSPANATYNTGVITLNASTNTGSTHALTITNVSFYYRNASTTTGWILISNVRNTTANQSSFTTTFDTSILYDDNTYEFNASGFNDTQLTISSQNVTKIFINHGNPTASYASNSIANQEDVKENEYFLFGLSADSTSGIKNCSIVMNGNYLSIASTNNVSCSAQIQAQNFSIIKSNGYSYQIQAHDGNGNLTNSSIRVLTIYFDTGGGGGGGSPKFGGITPILPEQASEKAQEAINKEMPEKRGIGRGIGEVVSNFIKNTGSGIGKLFGGIGNFFSSIFNK